MEAKQSDIVHPFLFFCVCVCGVCGVCGVCVCVQGSKLTVASSKFATWKFSLLPGQKVGSKKLLLGIVLQTLSTLSVVNIFSEN